MVGTINVMKLEGRERKEKTRRDVHIYQGCVSILNHSCGNVQRTQIIVDIYMMETTDK